jgi:hypothetical protein
MSKSLESLSVFIAPLNIPGQEWGSRFASGSSNAEAGASGSNPSRAAARRFSLPSPAAAEYEWLERLFGALGVGVLYDDVQMSGVLIVFVADILGHLKISLERGGSVYDPRHG